MDKSALFVWGGWEGHEPEKGVAVFKPLLYVYGEGDEVRDPVEVKPLFVSKANTAVQIVLAGWVLAELAFGAAFGSLRLWLVIASGILTVASAAAYLVSWLKHMAGYAESKTPQG